MALATFSHIFVKFGVDGALAVDLIADIDDEWEKPQCNEGSGGAGLGAFLLALLVTRSPHAPRRDRYVGVGECRDYICVSMFS